MADLTKTVSNSLNLFGGSPSTKWGSDQPMTWGTSKWGEGSSPMIRLYFKTITNSQPLSDAFSKGAAKVVLQDLVFTEDLSSESLGSGNGYSYVFPKPSTNAEDRSTPTYTDVSAGSTTYTSLTVASTTWS